MRKILIADRSERFCGFVADKLKDRFCVKICTDGYTALEMLRVEQPDLFVVDLELPGMDGLSILRCLRNSGRMLPTIALTTCVNSSYVQQTLNYMGVEYMLSKPVTAAAVANCVVDILNTKDRFGQTGEGDLADFLIGLGLRADLIGFRYLVEAIEIFTEDSTRQITKGVYPEIAKQFGATPVSVERAIRGLIQKAWLQRDMAVWSLYFSNCGNSVHAPSNSVFIAQMAVKFKNRKVC